MAGATAIAPDQKTYKFYTASSPPSSYKGEIKPASYKSPQQQQPCPIVRNITTTTTYVDKTSHDEKQVTNNLKDYLDARDLSIGFGKDGDILIKGVRLTLPDLDKKYKDEYNEHLKEIRKISCLDRDLISGWMKVATIGCALVSILLIIILCIYGIYSIFSSGANNNSSSSSSSSV